MKKLFSGIVMASALLSTMKISAQDKPTEPKEIQSKDSADKTPIGKFYSANALDGMIFSTALIDNKGKNSLGTLRFSMFFHFGSTLNYNINKNIGVYTGLDLKNIGFIEKFDALKMTTKDRVYTLGVPIGLRFGNMLTRDYFFMGGGLDVAFHYKHKDIYDNGVKTKYREWFSNYTNILLPYLFAGICLKSTTLKIQYYPTNFINENKVIGQDIYGNSLKPFLGKKVNLLLVSLGRDIQFKKKGNLSKML